MLGEGAAFTDAQTLVDEAESVVDLEQDGPEVVGLVVAEGRYVRCADVNELGAFSREFMGYIGPGAEPSDDVRARWIELAREHARIERAAIEERAAARGAAS